MENKAWPEMPIGRHFAVLSKFYVAALSKKLNEINLDRYFSIILLVHNSKEPVTQQMIGCQLHIDKTSMVRIIDSLVEKNYLKREVMPGDRRCHQIELTDLGRSIVPEIQKAIAELNDLMMKGVSKEHREQFVKSLSTVIFNLQEFLMQEKELHSNQETLNILKS